MFHSYLVLSEMTEYVYLLLLVWKGLIKRSKVDLFRGQTGFHAICWASDFSGK